MALNIHMVIIRYSPYTKGDLTIHVLVYVDGLIISGNTHDEIKDCKRYLSQCSCMKDLGHLKHFLGVEVA